MSPASVVKRKKHREENANITKEPNDESARKANCLQKHNDRLNTLSKLQKFVKFSNDIKYSLVSFTKLPITYSEYPFLYSFYIYLGSKTLIF